MLHVLNMAQSLYMVRRVRSIVSIFVIVFKVYGVKNVPFTGTFELRDSGTYGFFLPANQIVEVCAEVTDGLVGLIKAAEKEEILMRNSAHLTFGSLLNIFLGLVIVMLFSRYL